MPLLPTPAKPGKQRPLDYQLAAVQHVYCQLGTDKGENTSPLKYHFLKMSLPLLLRHLDDMKLTAYWDHHKVPAHARHQVRPTFEIDGNMVTLIEERHTLVKAVDDDKRCRFWG